MLEYWYSDAAKAWLIALPDGTLIAQFPDLLTIERHFEKDVLTHAYKQCDSYNGVS